MGAMVTGLDDAENRDRCPRQIVWAVGVADARRPSTQPRPQAGEAPEAVGGEVHLLNDLSVLTITFTLHDDADEILQWVRIYMRPDVPTPEETMQFATGTWAASQRM
jgi:hypothetical protein